MDGVKEIIRYVTSDGLTYDTKEGAYYRESFMKASKDLTAILDVIIDDYDLTSEEISQRIMNHAQEMKDIFNSIQFFR